MFQMYCSTMDLPLLAFPAVDGTWGAALTIHTYTPAVTAHTDRLLSAGQMARELDNVTRSTRRQSVPLKHGIDYSKTF